MNLLNQKMSNATIRKVVINRFGGCQITMNFFVETESDYEFIESKYDYQTNGDCELSEKDFYTCLSQTIKYIKNDQNINLIIPDEILDKLTLNFKITF